MPTDFSPQPVSGAIQVRDRAGIGLPFSKGLMATSVLATGLETDVAYRQIVEHVASPELALFVDDKARNVAASAGLGIESTWAGSDPSWLADVDRALGLTDRAYSDQCQAR